MNEKECSLKWEEGKCGVVFHCGNPPYPIWMTDSDMNYINRIDRGSVDIDIKSGSINSLQNTEASIKESANRILRYVRLIKSI